VPTVTNNVAFWSVGVGWGENMYYFFFDSSKSHYKIGSYTNAIFSSVCTKSFQESIQVFNASTTDVIAPLYLFSESVFLGQQVGLLLNKVNLTNDLYGVLDTDVGGRPVLKICLGADVSNDAALKQKSRVVMVYLDYWEY
jgi:hypothetical protein